MEQIYTIPVNEAFEECIENKGCPFCKLEGDLQNNEIDLILGASMMEPDIRKKTNELGFCKNHFTALFAGKKRLPLALILESHIDEVDSLFASPKIMPAMAGVSTAKKLTTLSNSCYICTRTENNFSKMLDCAAYLWETDPCFRKKVKKQNGFCIPHLARYLTASKARMKNATFAEFYKDIYNIEKAYIADTKEKLSRFARSFDYRYANEPIDDARDAVEKTIKLVSGTEVK